MIKINLLPVKAAKRREEGQKQLFMGMLAVAGTLAAIVVYHGTLVSQAHGLKQRNLALSTEIAKLKAELGDYDVVKKQRSELLRQRDAIKKLQSNRAGPVWMMRELSNILSPGKGPTFDKEAYEERIKRDPSDGFNPNWDTRRVWILGYTEKDHDVKIRGAAKSDEDVAEFLKRLKVSAFFTNVYWQQTQPQLDSRLNVSYVTFDVTCRVDY